MKTLWPIWSSGFENKTHSHLLQGNQGLARNGGFTSSTPIPGMICKRSFSNTDSTPIIGGETVHRYLSAGSLPY